MVQVSWIMGFLLLQGCANFSLESRRAKALEIITNTGHQEKLISTSEFELTSFQKITDENAPLMVYLPGDGYAFRSLFEPSKNPTPRKHLTLRLAIEDSSANVVFLSRPCQYLSFVHNSSCGPFYWTSGRYSERVVASLNSAISKIKKTPEQDVHLIGFSGGGALAILIASRRKDVKSVRTLAGNLNHALLMTKKSVTPLHKSLDAINAAQGVNNIPQLHYFGAQDSVVPEWVSKSYIQKSKSLCVQRKRVMHTSHNSGWLEFWKKNHKNIPQLRCADSHK